MTTGIASDKEKTPPRKQGFRLEPMQFTAAYSVLIIMAAILTFLPERLDQA